MAEKIIRIDQKNKRLKIKAFELQQPIVFEYFNSLPEKERDEKFLNALYIGVLAMKEDRLAAFLSKTSNELGTELENLKMIFDFKKEVFFKTAGKGFGAEEDIAEFLESFFKQKGLKDRCRLTGNERGVLPRNKTGDIICEVAGDEGKKIVIECKFDKSFKLEDIIERNVFKNKTDTAWSQILEARANREAKVGMIVFDKALVDNSILKYTDSVGYIKGVGFVVIVDSQSGDYTNLAIAYMLARDIVLNAKVPDIDPDTLAILVKRLIYTLKHILDIRNMVQKNIDNNLDILNKLEQNMLLMEFNHKYLQKFLKDGKLSSKDLIDFYMADEVREKYKAIKNDIQKIKNK